MRINYARNRYAEWTPGSRLIELYVDGCWQAADAIHVPEDASGTAVLRALLDYLRWSEIVDNVDITPEPMELSLCVDCAYLDANGLPNILSTPDCEPLSLLDGIDIGPTDQHCCEGHFSWSPCEGCGSRLGGLRFCYVGIQTKGA